MKKLIRSFLFFGFLIAFVLVISQFSHHSWQSTTSKAKTSDQLAQEAWESKKTGFDADGKIGNFSFPLQLHQERVSLGEPKKLFSLKRMGINGINPENNNLLETVKETAPLKTYDQLSSVVKAELRNLVQISGWAEKLKNLYQKTRLKWQTHFWDKIQTKYLFYLKKYNITDIIWVKNFLQLKISKSFLSLSDVANLSFENLTPDQKKSIPDVYHKNWESYFRKAINVVALQRSEQPPFPANAKAIWENTLSFTYLADLKKYQITEINGIEIASLFTLTSKNQFVDFTFQQQDQIHNLIDLPNYQTLLTAAIKPKKQADVFWTNPVNRAKINQLLNYDLLTVFNIYLDQFTSNDLTKSFLDLTSQQWEQLSQLINSKDYDEDTTILLQQEKKTEEFWNENKDKIKKLLTYQLLIINNVAINQFNLSDINKTYLILNKSQKNQLRKLINLENYASKITLLLSEEEQAKNF